MQERKQTLAIRITTHECELLQFHKQPFSLLLIKEYTEYTSRTTQAIMNEPTPIRIRPKLYQEMEAERPEIFTDTTTWGNYLLRVGLNYHMGLDPCGRLKTERPTERKKEGREVFYTSKVNNIINKEKSKKWVFRENHIPKSLEFCKDLIVKFWGVKKGFHTEDAFKLLIGPKGLNGIYTNHGQSAVTDQLEEGIANKWQSITLKNYEAFGRPKKADKEPVTGHPAQRLWKDGGFVE